MYINIVLGIAVIVVLYWIAHEIVRNKKSPATLLREEIAQRNSRKALVATNLEKIRKEAEERMRPVNNGLREMVGALPKEERPCILPGGEHGGIEILFTAGDAVNEAGGSMRVSHRLASFTVNGTPEDIASDFARYERFLIERFGPDGETRERAEYVTSAETLRHVARILAEYAK